MLQKEQSVNIKPSDFEESDPPPVVLTSGRAPSRFTPDLERLDARCLQYRPSAGIEAFTAAVRVDLGLGPADGKYVVLRVYGDRGMP